FAQALVCLTVAFEVREMQVVVAEAQQRVQDRIKDAGLIATETVARDEIERGAGLGVMVVMPLRIVKAASLRHLVGGQSKQKEIRFTGGFGHFDGGAVA